MGVLPIGLRAASREVLRHARDALRAELVTLKATDVCREKTRRELAVLAERSGAARPARLGAQVCGRMERGTDPEGDVLPPRDVAERLHKLLVARSGEPDRLGPGRQRTGRQARGRVVAEAVPRVTGDRHRDPEARLLGEPLQPVVPRRRLTRSRRPIDVEVVDEPLAHELRGRNGRERRRFLEELTGRADADRRVVHEPGLLLDRQLRKQVVDAFLERPSGILVRVEPPVAVEVTELHPEARSYWRPCMAG